MLARMPLSKSTGGVLQQTFVLSHTRMYNPRILTVDKTLVMHFKALGFFQVLAIYLNYTTLQLSKQKVPKDCLVLVWELQRGIITHVLFVYFFVAWFLAYQVPSCSNLGDFDTEKE